MWYPKFIKTAMLKKKVFKRLSELIGMSAKWEVQKGVYHIYRINSTIRTKVLPIDNLPNFPFFFHLSIIAVMETTAAISCKLTFLNDKKYFDKNYFILTVFISLICMTLCRFVELCSHVQSLQLIDKNLFCNLSTSSSWTPG